MISEHASPLATLGGKDSGGQNVYVAELARRLGGTGHEVDVFTRRDDGGLPAVVPFSEGVRVVNVAAGPARTVPKDDIFRFMPDLRDAFYRFAGEEPVPYDLVHANFWMSGWVACEAKRDLGLPFAQTFHALGEVKRREQGDADTSPPERKAAEMRIVEEADRILATCPAEVEELTTLYGRTTRSSPSCRAAWTARSSGPWTGARRGTASVSPTFRRSCTSGGSSRGRGWTP